MSRDQTRARLSSKLRRLARADPALDAVASAVASAGNGTPLDAQAVFASGASLSRSFLLDLAYEEFCQREEAGEVVDPAAFCERFSSIRSSLQRQLDVHRILQENPQLLNEIAETRWPEVPETFLEFSLVKELGRGAFGRVFLATEPALANRRVVVKVSLHGGAEAATLARLEHPNVVPVFSVRDDPESGLTAICMPYLGCATLCDVLDHAYGSDTLPRHAGTILDAVRLKSLELDLPDESSGEASSILRHGLFEEGGLLLAARLAEGLAFVHGQGVCHRDLKPSNVLVSANGQPLLLDFNLSADERQGDRRLGGTLPFMSPEQLRATAGDGTPGKVDFRSDLFSLGVVLYQLLSGRHPFGPLPASGDLRAILLERQHGHSVRLKSILPEVDCRLDRAIQRCLCLEPSDRPASAAALAIEFRSLLSWRRRIRRRLARRWKGVLAAAACLTVAGAVGWQLLPPPEPTVVRHLRVARVSYRQGNLQDALDRYSYAIAEDPESFEAYFGRGRTFVKMGQFPPAMNDFSTAFTQSREPKAEACVAFCMAKMALHRQAIDRARTAIALGYATAAVYNNLGYSQIQINQLADAQSSLDQALGINDRLQAAYYNRALLDRKLFLQKKGYVPLRGVKDVRKAIEIGPETAKLCFDAAYLCAAAARTDKKWIEAALHHARKAIEMGQDPATFRTEPVFAILALDVRFQSLMQVSPLQREPSLPIRLIDPVDD